MQNPGSLVWMHHIIDHYSDDGALCRPLASLYISFVDLYNLWVSIVVAASYYYYYTANYY